MSHNVLIAALVATVLAGSPSLAQSPAFADRTGEIEHIYDGGWEHFVGGGATVFDCSGDGLPEIYAAGGKNPAVLLRNESAGSRLTFREATPETLALTSVIGAYPLHLDTDGHADLVLLRNGENRVFRGKGGCEFKDVTNELGLSAIGGWTTAFSATWEAGRQLPTLAFGNYVDRDDPEGPFEACAANQLYRADENVYGAPITLEPGFCALSMLFSDWGRRGRADLRISNDRHYYVRGGEEQMWRMGPEPRLYTQVEGWRRHQLWGMGIASRDITGDGLPEVFLSSMGDQRLQMLENGADSPSYQDARFELGTSAHRPHAGDDGRPSTGWQISFGDVDNDGRNDVFIAKGNVDQMPGSAMNDPNNLLLQQADGTFKEAAVEANIASPHRSRGAVLADLNDDGLLDLIVVNRRANVEIYENVSTETGNWLKVELRQPAPNIAAIGAWIELEAPYGKAQSREFTIGGGHASGALGPEHFGLGDKEEARLRVVWPGGETSDWHDVVANQSLRVWREYGAALRIEPVN